MKVCIQFKIKMLLIVLNPYKTGRVDRIVGFSFHIDLTLTVSLLSKRASILVLRKKCIWCDNNYLCDIFKFATI
jgi:hypothetical protein